MLHSGCVFSNSMRLPFAKLLVLGGTGALLSCSPTAPRGDVSKVLRAAAPSPSEGVSLSPIKDGAKNAKGGIGRAREAVVKAEGQAKESALLADRHAATLRQLQEEMGEQAVHHEATLKRLGDELVEYVALDSRRRSTISDLRENLDEARVSIENILLTHVPAAELQEAKSALEKEQLRKLGSVGAAVVEGMEEDLAETAKYKTHYDSRWGKYLKIISGTVVATLVVGFGVFAYIRR